LKTVLRIALTLLPTFCALGCSTDENPISPQKMLEIRQKEQADRKNFNPTMSAPPGGAK